MPEQNPAGCQIVRDEYGPCLVPGCGTEISYTAAEPFAINVDQAAVICDAARAITLQENDPAA